MKAWRWLVISDHGYKHMLSSFTYLIVLAQQFQLNFSIKESHQKNTIVSIRNRFHLSKEMIKDKLINNKVHFLVSKAPLGFIWRLTPKHSTFTFHFQAFLALMLNFFVMWKNRLCFLEIQMYRCELSYNLVFLRKVEVNWTTFSLSAWHMNKAFIWGAS